MNKLELQKTANEVRKGIVTAVHSAKAGHPGGSLSAADLFTYLYFEEMNINPEQPDMENRDRFVLSKGHTAPGLYAALAYKGFFPVEDLPTLRHIGSYLQGHPDMKHIPGVDMSSGSLGQGISAAVGMAISAKLSNDSYRVYTLLGDGEIQEGQVWEAAMLAAHRKLDNFVAIIDNNGLQIDGAIDEVCSPYRDTRACVFSSSAGSRHRPAVCTVYHKQRNFTREKYRKCGEIFSTSGSSFLFIVRFARFMCPSLPKFYQSCDF